MRKKLVVVASLALALSSLQVVAQKKKSDKNANLSEKVTIKTTNDTISYAYGVTVAEQGLKQYLEQQGIDMNNPEKMQKFLQGMNEGLLAEGGKTEYVVGLGVGDQMYRMSESFSDEVLSDNPDNKLNMSLISKAIMDVLQNNSLMIDNSKAITDSLISEVSKKKEEIEKEQSKVQIEAAEKFMEENKSQAGVITLPSGLQYKVLVEGNGEKPTLQDNVKVHYKGTLTDGTQFDSSYDRNEPISLGVGQVIPGWTEALQLMPVGSKWMLYVPYELGYGSRGAGNIPAYSNLIFEVELLSIN